MDIAGLVKNSFVDYPGKIACVIFLPSCNYDCFFCHNRQLLQGGYEPLSMTSLNAFLRKRKDDIEGVVVSGGEPTIHNALSELLTNIKNFGYSVKLDTNGSNPEKVKELAEKALVDYVAVDYKAPLARYSEFAGSKIKGENAIATIGYLLSSGLPFEVRTTVAPGLGERELMEMAKELPKLSRYVLNRYRKPEIYPDKYKNQVQSPALTESEIIALKPKLKQFQPNIV